ncbi:MULTISPECIES: transposase [unclassified Streptomyces]|uniref:transposase n=1 Tax=unclassified Streptomyces TaxID=2593676 RepID=UPI00380F5BD6
MVPTSARKRGADTGPSPVDRRRTGSKHHLICDGSGTPLEVITTTANVNDITQTDNLIDGIPPVAGRPGRPRRRPESILGNKAYDSKAVRRKRRRRRILPFISLKGPRASRAWASSATSSSRLSPCSTSANVSLSNGNDASNSTTPWSHWAAASSAGDASRRLNRELMLQLWELRLTIELAYDARSWTQTCRRRLLSMSKRGRVCR